MNDDSYRYFCEDYSGDELVDAAFVARISGLSVRTIQDLATKREFPLYKLGNRCNRFKIRDISNWIDSKRIDNNFTKMIEKNKAVFLKTLK